MRNGRETAGEQWSEGWEQCQVSCILLSSTFLDFLLPLKKKLSHQT